MTNMKIEEVIYSKGDSIQQKTIDDGNFHIYLCVDK